MFGWLQRLLKSPEISSPTTFHEHDDLVELLRVCRERMGPAPRALSAKDIEASRLILPPEIMDLFTQLRDPMLQIVQDQHLLWERGELVWGHLVQANRMLFDPNNQLTLPANVVYSMDPYFDGRLAHLGQIARGLFAQKGTTPADCELREFVRVITDERERIMRRELPRGYCGGKSVYFTNCFIHPDHLPGHCLRGSEFPLLVNFRETEAVMLLPGRFWPYAMTRDWTA